MWNTRKDTSPHCDQVKTRSPSAGRSGNQEISQRLNIASSTVRNTITRIRYKLGLDSRAKLMAYAFRHGLMDDVTDGASVPDAAN